MSAILDAGTATRAAGEQERSARPAGAAGLHDEVCRLAWQVTEASHRLQRALRHKDRLSRLLDTVLENLDAGVVLLRGDGALLASNGAAASMGAVRADQGSAPSLHPDVAGAAVAGAGEREDGVLRPCGPGGPAWIVRGGAVSLPEGGEGRLLLVHDVTRLVELEERAHRRSRLELLGRMAAELAHEVRTPLGSLELFAGLLLDELEPDSEAHELATQLQVGVRRMSATVGRLLGAARGGRGPRRETDLVALAKDTMELVQPLAYSREARLELDARVESADIEMDAESVRQALLNLLGNALDAAPRGGRVRLSVEADASRARIAVCDSGPGVPRELRERIFEPFFSTRDEGTGLGLAVVERVALAHDGAVAAGESEWGGARFEMTLSREAGSETRPPAPADGGGTA